MEAAARYDSAYAATDLNGDAAICRLAVAQAAWT